MLLDFYVEGLDGQELADWLRQLGVQPTGSVQERRERVRANTKYLTMAATDFPKQTRYYIEPYTSEHLADLCMALGLSDDGSREDRYRRVMREVHYREGWLDRWVGGTPTTEVVARHLELLPIARRGRLERDFCQQVWGELSEVFGERNVHEQLAIAHGSTLKIDFHIGPPQGEGIGVEVKVPASNSEIQRAMGQIDQYRTRYGENLIMLVFADFVSEASLALLEDHLRAKAIRTILHRVES
jgi:hypothetical protein